MEFLIILFLLILNGIFAMYEIALVSSSKARLETLVAKGNKSARGVLKQLEEPEKFLSTIQIGITLIGIVSGAYGGVAIADDLVPFFSLIPGAEAYARNLAMITTVAIITYLSLIIGELVPKSIALSNPERYATLFSPVMILLTKVSYPFVWLLSVSTRLLNKLIGLKSEERPMTQEEIKMILHQSSEQGVIDKEETEMIRDVFRFSDKRANELMTHRRDLIILHPDDTQEKVMKIIEEEHYSKYLLVDERKDEIIGEADKIVDITVAIDKLDKIGLDNVNAELKEKGISDEAIAKLQPIILLNGTNAEKLGTLKEVLSASEVGLKGVEESEFILNTLETMGLKNEIELDLTLARGLNYYTGAIFEVKALDVQIGSITGGGRYDNLTGVFGMSGVSGVGISFGADRIFDVLNQLELYPKEAVNGTEVLFINFGEKEAAFSMGVLAKVRAAGIRAEIFPDASKMKKQMSYANAKNIPFVAIVGENEMNEGKVMLKNMETGEQNLLSAEELIAAVKR